VATLSHWLLTDRCRLIAVLGMGGIGKTLLAARLARDVAPRFAVVYWRSLRNAPPVEEWLAGAIAALSAGQALPPDGRVARLALVLELLRERRGLLVLDNLETILESGAPAARYRDGYAGYGEALRRVGESVHQGCLLVTGREAPPELAPLAGERGPVRTLRLGGLAREAGRALLRDTGLVRDEAAWDALIARYNGNPLALGVVGETVGAAFGGDIAAFLAQDTVVFGSIRELLDGQVERLTALERAIVSWLAVEREPVGFGELVADLGPGVSRAEVMEAMEGLQRRSLLERGAGGAVTLQPVVLEYATARLVARVCEEALSGQSALLVRQALVKATAKDYVRRSQERLIAQPLLEQLHGSVGRADVVERRLVDLLEAWRGRLAREQGYGPGNAFNLLRLLRGNVRGLDFSRLAIRHAYLAGIEMQDASLAGSHLSEVILSEAFTDPTAVALSPDGVYLAMGTSTGEVTLRRVADRTLTMAVQGHSDPCMGIAVSADGRLVASGSFDGTARLWDAENGRLRATLEGHRGLVWRVALSADGRLLASGSEDGTVNLWEATPTSASSGRLLATLQGHTSGVRSVALSADGRLVASGDRDGTVKLWATESGQLLATMQGHTGTVWGVALSADGRRLASGSYDGTARLWETESGRLLATLQGHSGGVPCVALSGDGRLVVSGGEDGTVRLWEAETGQLRATLRGHSGVVWSVALSADGRLLTSGGRDGTARLWEVESGQLLATLHGHSSIQCLTLSADGRLLVSGDRDGKARLWEVESGRLLATLQAHSSIYSVALSTDGRLLVSSTMDGTVRLWEAESGRLLMTLQEHSGVAWDIALSANGGLLASGSDDGTVRLWDLSRVPNQGVNPRTLRGDRRCERLDITGLTGVTDAQRAGFLALGAAEQSLAQAARSTEARVVYPPSDTPTPASIPEATPVPLTAPPGASARPPTNLPPARNTFVGRAVDLATLTQALNPATYTDPRLLILTGVAGCGKTRLALAVAEEVRTAYADGVWLVELAPLPASPSADPTAVAAAALSALGRHEQPGQALLDTLVASLRARHMLLVLDNCEHVVAASAALATRLLEVCPRVQILATSQRALGIADEIVWRVDTLAVPPAVDGPLLPEMLSRVGQSDAVRLFVERAQAVQPGFELSPATAAGVVALCRQLDGLPLAIELAAARLNVLPVEHLLARLDDRFRLLRRGGRSAADHHQTLQATLDWSYGLLDPAEQALLRRLAVFVGGWEVAAAEAVCAGEDVAIEAVLEVLDELLERSLVSVSTAGGAPRYGLLETVRQYGAQQLERADETEALRDRHLRWCVTLAEQAAPALLGAEQALWLARLEREHDNLRAALQWALDRGRGALGLRLAAGLWQFWRSRSHLSEGRRWLAAVLALPTDDDASRAARASALEGAGWLTEDEHEFAQASALFTQSEALRRALGQDERTTGLLINAAMEARARGDYARATTLLEESLAQQRARGNRESIKRGGLGLALARLALVLAEQGQHTRARALYEECLALHRELGDREGIGNALLGLGDIARDLGDTAGVRAYCEETLTLFRELGHTWVGFSLNNLALAAYLDGDLALATRRAEESVALFRGLRAGPSLAEALVTLGRVRGA